MPARTAELITPRLRLRRPRAEDVQAIHAIMSDPEAMRYWSIAAARVAGRNNAVVRRHAGRRPRGRERRICDRLSWRGDRQGRGRRLPEIGFFIRRDQWGKGFASEALAAFVAYLREEGVPALLADVDPRNAACLALLKKAGFEESGRAAATYTIGGQVCDSVYLQLELPPRP